MANDDKTAHRAGNADVRRRGETPSPRKMTAAARRMIARQLRRGSRRDDGFSGPDAKWFQEHAARFLAALRWDARKTPFLSGAEGRDLWAACLAFAETGRLPEEKSLAAFFGAPGLSLPACEALPGALAAAAGVRVARGFSPSKKTDGIAAWGARFLSALERLDPEALPPLLCEAERLLLKDPAGLYALLSPETKHVYRSSLTRLAKRARYTETAAARGILAACEKETGERSHVGSRLPLTKPCFARLFFAVETLCALILSGALTANLLRSPAAAPPFSAPAVRAAAAAGLGVFFFFSATGILRPLFDLLSAKLVRPRFLPRLDEENEAVPLPGALVAVSSLLPSAENAGALYPRLKALSGAAGSESRGVVLLSDLPAAKTPTLPTDKADIEAAKQVIDRLNREHGGGFLLLLRERVYAPTEDAFAGYERKRGAIEALVKAVKRGENGFFLTHGDQTVLEGAAYVLTLDADTGLPPGTLRRLLCTACHPQNRAVVKDGRVVAGYGCFAPRMCIAPTDAGNTLFRRLMTGADASVYTPRVSERHMDLTGTGLFCGKGLIDVAAYNAVLVDAFNEGTVLSHDMPEGALLSTAYVSDAVLTEDFPARPAAWLRRTHRWLRGDVQNLRFLCRPLKEGNKDKKLPLLQRCILLDNVRHAAGAPLAAGGLLLSAFLPGAAAKTFFLLSLLFVAAPSLPDLLQAGVQSLCAIFSRRFSAPAPQTLCRTLLLPFLRFGLLPVEAAVHLDAMVRAAYRSLITHKKTLEWTTAAQSEKKNDRAVFYTALCPFLYAAALLPGGRAFWPLSALILLTVPFSLFSGKERKRPGDVLSDAERETLRMYAAATWRYFDRYVSAGTNGLPPDNVQETPVFRAADRTSPTNIGLYLLSLLAAADLRLITPATLFLRLEMTLDTLERLPKYRGLLYNWYDIKTLRVLPPAFVSSVDCGNFLVCLTTLREGLGEYLPLVPGMETLCARILSLEKEADLACLYDRRRKLFAVGMDTRTGTLTDAAYVYYMSESRLTSFYAVAKGYVPLSHWGTLSRATVGRAAAAFSGTAFEYLMPTLFLPVLPDTFEERSLRRCVRLQERRAKKYHAAMGVTESGYYAFDSELNYLYKAHGLRQLSMAAAPFTEPVFAPYAAFLALSVDKKAAMAALSRFSALSAFGSCGFFEAVDFTRRADPARFRVVRSFMAHHVGMSLLAVANALTDRRFVRRFFADPNIFSAAGLLPEAFPAALPLRSPKKEQKELRPPRPGELLPEQAKRVSLFSDGEGTLLCGRQGQNHFLYAGMSMLNFSGRSPGVFTAVRQGGTLTPLSGYAPAVHKAACVRTAAAAGPLQLKSALALASGTGALVVRIRAENKSRAAVQTAFLWYLEPGFFPVLAPPAHPAFRDMRLRAKYDPDKALLCFYREENGETGPYLCIGFEDASPLHFCCDRESVLGSDPCRPYPFFAGDPPLTDRTDFVRPAAAVVRRRRIPPGSDATLTLLAVPGADEESAVRALVALRRRPPTARTAAKDLLRANAPAQNSIRRLLEEAFFEKAKPVVTPNGGRPAGVRSLWEQGISGDLPVLRAKIDSLPPAALLSLLRAHALLAAAGVPFDLALLTDRPGVYGEDVPPALSNALTALGLAGFGGRGGRHLLRRPACSPAFLSALAAAAGADYPVSPPKASDRLSPAAPPLPSAPLFPQENHFVPGGYYAGRPTLRPWSHVLANRSFGTLVTNASLGFTWALNARLNPITPWENDPCSHFSGERLELLTAQKTYDCIAGASAFFYDDKAVWGAVCGGARLRVSVRVDAVAMKKEVSVAFDFPAGKPPALAYRITPQLCENPFHKSFVRVSPAGNGVLFYNAANTDFPGTAFLFCDMRAECSAFPGGVALTASDLPQKGTLTFTLLFSAGVAGGKRLASLPFRPQTPVRIRPKTGDPAADRFAGALLLHQTVTVRLLARTGFYQNSGAWGFRDQLQDAMNTAALTPSLTRTVLLRSAAAQFPEGDVLHWFHVLPAPVPRRFGVRTRCADDRLWLPLAVAVYAETTGDFAVLDTPLPFLEGAPLSPAETERCGEFRRGGARASLYDHCMRALHLNAGQTGPHGLSLFLGGDWNDGMNEAGKRGQGESVWLTLFFKYVCERFSALSQRRGKTQDAAFLTQTAAAAKRAAEAHGWNGGWFRRGFTDDGTPLGDPGCPACEIDLTVQAWATLANVGTGEQQKQALSAAFHRLYSADPPLVRLLSPPFGKDAPRVGYIGDYPPGVRENGGQYTHAAVWFMAALRQAGMEKEASDVLRAILPPAAGQALERFRNEPYALSADVSAGESFPGRGGWSLYTGAAGWLLKYFLDN